MEAYGEKRQVRVVVVTPFERNRIKRLTSKRWPTTRLMARRLMNHSKDSKAGRYLGSIKKGTTKCLTGIRTARANGNNICRYDHGANPIKQMTNS